MPGEGCSHRADEMLIEWLPALIVVIGSGRDHIAVRMALFQLLCELLGCRADAGIFGEWS
jgi:hypothetical protein